MFLLGEKARQDLSFTPIGADDGDTASIHESCAEEDQLKPRRLGTADMVALLKVGGPTGRDVVVYLTDYSTLRPKAQKSGRCK